MTYEKYIRNWLRREKIARQNGNLYVVKANGLEFLMFNDAGDTHLLAIQDKDDNLFRQPKKSGDNSRVRSRLNVVEYNSKNRVAWTYNFAALDNDKKDLTEWETLDIIDNGVYIERLLSIDGVKLLTRRELTHPTSISDYIGGDSAAVESVSSVLSRVHHNCASIRQARQSWVDTVGGENTRRGIILQNTVFVSRPQMDNPTTCFVSNNAKAAPCIEGYELTKLTYRSIRNLGNDSWLNEKEMEPIVSGRPDRLKVEEFLRNWRKWYHAQVRMRKMYTYKVAAASYKVGWDECWVDPKGKTFVKGLSFSNELSKEELPEISKFWYEVKVNG